MALRATTNHENGRLGTSRRINKLWSIFEGILVASVPYRSSVAQTFVSVCFVGL